MSDPLTKFSNKVETLLCKLVGPSSVCTHKDVGFPYHAMPYITVQTTSPSGQSVMHYFKIDSHCDHEPELTGYAIEVAEKIAHDHIKYVMQHLLNSEPPPVKEKNTKEPGEPTFSHATLKSIMDAMKDPIITSPFAKILSKSAPLFDFAVPFTPSFEYLPSPQYKPIPVKYVHPPPSSVIAGVACESAFVDDVYTILKPAVAGDKVVGITHDGLPVAFNKKKPASDDEAILEYLEKAEKV